MKYNLKNQGFKSRFHIGTGFSLIIGLFLLVLSFALSGKNVYAQGLNAEDKTDYIVVIDPGHGGENLGTTENGFVEKDMDYRTALVMAETLRKYEHITVYLTRTAEEDLSLEERAEYAASVNADFLISVHYNASVKHDLFGTEAWVQLNSPLHAYGYTFAKIWLGKYAEEGFFLRGVKTKESETTKNIDYYGILRHCAAAEIPAVIIEHGHVDHKNDCGKLDDESEQIHYGIIDGLAVAEFLGLSLKEEYLGEEELISYQVEQPPVKTVEESKIFFDSINSWTIPEVCSIEKVSEDYEKGIATITVNASDFDSPLIYYSYSNDGGATYSELFAWPECDVMTGTYKDTVTLEVPLRDNKFSFICVKAYNLFDQCTNSNILDGYEVYHKAEEIVEPEVDSPDAEQAEGEAVTAGVPPTPKETPEGVILTELPSDTEEWTIEDLRNDSLDKLVNFLLLSLFVVVCILWLVFILILFYRKKTKK